MEKRGKLRLVSFDRAGNFMDLVREFYTSRMSRFSGKCRKQRFARHHAGHLPGIRWLLYLCINEMLKRNPQLTEITIGYNNHIFNRVEDFNKNY